MRCGDTLTVTEADRPGRTLLEALIVLNDLFEQGVAVKTLDGTAPADHTERSLILDLALALAEDHRRDIARKTKSGLGSAARADSSERHSSCSRHKDSSAPQSHRSRTPPA